MAGEDLTGTGRQKKIVIIANFATDRVNGAYNVIENIAIHTNKLGYRCELWGLSTELDRNNYPFYVHFAANLLLFKVPDELQNKLISDKDDIICVNLHSVFTPINIGISKLAKELNIPLCLTPQGGYHDYTFKRNFLKKALFLLLFERSFLKRIDYFFIHGKQEAGFIKKYSSKKCYTLLNGFPEGKITKPAYNYQDELKSPTLKLLFMGRLDPLHKGLDLLIKGMALLKDIAVELTILGPQFNAESQKYLYQLVDDLDLSKTVVIKDPVYNQAEKEKLYAEHHLFIHTSRWEGMPTGVIETLFYGMPVLVSKGTNLAEIVEKEQMGIAIDQLTSANIADAIITISKNRQRLKTLSENSYTKSPDIFDWNKIAGQYAGHIYGSENDLADKI